ncbi:MAG: hypothetical protein EOM93_06865 [Gammaproteobacteria bacterium]|nr:hypothetical protein [Gammaproteobacteria bacterium]
MNDLKKIIDATNSVTNSVRSLDSTTDQTQQALMKAGATLQLMSGVASMAGVLTKVMHLRNQQAMVVAETLTAVRAATGPAGWGIIAVATAAATAGGVAVYGMLTAIRGDTETSIGRATIAGKAEMR